MNEALERKRQTLIEYDKAISEIEAAYIKIMESSHTLLHVLRREAKNLDKKVHDH
jgi:Sjoegren syndrome nuclear autoantigen 1